MRSSFFPEAIQAQNRKHPTTRYCSIADIHYHFITENTPLINQLKTKNQAKLLIFIHKPTAKQQQTIFFTNFVNNLPPRGSATLQKLNLNESRKSIHSSSIRA
jgi:hypothetical protein